MGVAKIVCQIRKKSNGMAFADKKKSYAKPEKIFLAWDLHTQKNPKNIFFAY